MMCCNVLKKSVRIIVLPLLTVLISSCASTKGYYGRAEANVAEVSSQKHKVTVGKKNSWEIARTSARLMTGWWETTSRGSRRSARCFRGDGRLRWSITSSGRTIQPALLSPGRCSGR